MKKAKVTSLICGGILSLTGSHVLAQQSTSTDQNSSSSSSQSSSRLGSSSTTPDSQASSTLGGQSSTSGAYGSSSSMSSGRNVRLSQIMNGSVQSQEGKTLGQIRDVIVDPQSGRIQFAILSLSSAGGSSDTSTSGRETVPSSRSSVTGTPSIAPGSTMTGKLVPVPWQLLSQGMTSGHGASSASSSTLGGSSSMSSPKLVLNLDETKLRSAPSFDATDWSQLQGGSLDQRVYSHYGVERSSGYGTSGSSISGGSGSSSDSHSQGGIGGSRGTSGAQDKSSGLKDSSSGLKDSSSGLKDSTTPPSSSTPQK